MRTEKEIREKLLGLRSLLNSELAEEELIMSSKTKAKINLKITMLLWVLGEYPQQEVKP